MQPGCHLGRQHYLSYVLGVRDKRKEQKKKENLFHNFFAVRLSM